MYNNKKVKMFKISQDNILTHNEADLFIPYLELFRNKGIPGLFRQHEYMNSNKPLIEFLKEPA